MALETNKSNVSSNRTVSRAAFKVALGGLFSLIAGFASQVLMASIFGAGAEMDAFFTALVVPAYLTDALVIGLLFVFVPVFVQEETTEREDDAWALAGTFLWLTGGILAVIAVGGSLFARGIIAISAPGLGPTKADLAASMLAVLMFSVPLTGLGSLTAGIQNARNRFFWPAVAIAVGSVGNVTTLLVLHRAVGPRALALGYLVSAALQACVTLVPVLRHGWTRLIPLSDSRVHGMVRLLAPFIFFGLLTSCIPLFERYFASGLPDGELSYLGYASRIARIAMALLGTSIATAIFPAMARAYAQGGEVGLVEKVEYGLRLTLAVALPALAILSAVAVPLVTVLFERGAFEHTATLSIVRIVPIVILESVVFLMAHHVIHRTYYVIKDIHTIPMVGAGISVLYILLARVWIDPWGYMGLALAKAVIAGLALLVLFWVLTRKLRSLHTGRLLKDTLIYGTASLIAFFGAWLVSHALAFLPALPQLMAAGIVAGCLYIIFLFRVDRDIAVSILDMTGVQLLATRLGLLRIARCYAVDSVQKADR